MLPHPARSRGRLTVLAAVGVVVATGAVAALLLWPPTPLDIGLLEDRGSDPARDLEGRIADASEHLSACLAEGAPAPGCLDGVRRELALLAQALKRPPKQTAPQCNVEREQRFLDQMVEFLSATGKRNGEWGEDRLFAHVLVYLTRNDHQLLRLYLAQQARGCRRASAKTDLSVSARGLEKVAQHLVYTTAPERGHSPSTQGTLDFVALVPGEKVADIGAGAGFYSVRFAERVGAGGRVYALDIQPAMVAFVEETAKELNLPQIESLLSERDRVVIPPDSIDVAFVSNTMLEFLSLDDRSRRSLFGSIAAALREGGRLVVCDHDVPDMDLSQDRVRAILADLGFDVVASWPAERPRDGLFCLRAQARRPAARTPAGG
jgi:SAM-dependent methyltransferase